MFLVMLVIVMDVNGIAVAGITADPILVLPYNIRSLLDRSY